MRYEGNQVQLGSDLLRQCHLTAGGKRRVNSLIAHEQNIIRKIKTRTLNPER